MTEVEETNKREIVSLVTYVSKISEKDFLVGEPKDPLNSQSKANSLRKYEKAFNNTGHLQIKCNEEAMNMGRKQNKKPVTTHDTERKFKSNIMGNTQYIRNLHSQIISKSRN
jgi:hypothetical protein